MVKVLVGYPSLKVTQTCQEISRNFKNEIRICKGGLLGCPVRLSLNRGKLAGRDIGENKAWYKRVPPVLKMIAVVKFGTDWG